MLRATLQLTCIILIATAGAYSLAAASAPSATQPAADGSQFRKNVKVEVTDDLLIVRSNGIPDHDTGPFPNPRNPNTIREQRYVFKIPRHPKWSDHVTKTPMGPIGVAINGIPFYNPYNAQGQDAAKNEVFDECCGHPDPMGRYHYHVYPKCIHTSFKDEPGQHSPLIGYAFDGYAIYGPNGDGGKPPADLDECNGHSDPVRGYHYHVTNKFPYVIGGYHGVVEQSNFDGAPPNRPSPMPGRGGSGRPGYHLLPRFTMDRLDLSEEQRKQLADLEADVRLKLKAILTPEQFQTLDQTLPPPPPPTDAEPDRQPR
jgi:hypothetical protein